MALWGGAVLLWTGAAVYGPQWPGVLPPPQPVCQRWTEDVCGPRPRLGCAQDSEPGYAGDRRIWTGAGWRLQPGGMRGAWRRLLGLPLDLNRASLADLTLIDGIGPHLAAALVAHRQRLGGFASLQQLRQVRGIGPKLAARLQQAVTLPPARRLDERARLR